MADRIAVMNAGRLQQYAEPEKLYNKPANIFVAGFIGNPPMNFIDGTVYSKNGRFFFDSGEFTMELSKEIGEIVTSKASEVVMGFRPEHVKISLSEQPNSVEGLVYVVEPLGRDVVVNVKIGSIVVKILASPDLNLEPGQKIWLIFDQRRLHFFDKKSGLSLLV